MKKVLFIATLVKNHMMEFHVPYLKLFKEMGLGNCRRGEKTTTRIRQIASSLTAIHSTMCPLSVRRSSLVISLPTAWSRRSSIRGIMISSIAIRLWGAMITRLAARDARKKGTAGRVHGPWFPLL